MQRTIFTMAAVVAITLLFTQAGCGGGGDSTTTQTVTATPTPNNASIPTVMARRIITSDGTPGVFVVWQTSVDVPVQNVIEYQIYRDGQIIGTRTQAVNNFSDVATGVPTTLAYNKITEHGGDFGGNNGSGTQSQTTNSLTQFTTTVSPLVASVPVRYQIRVIYQEVVDGVITYRETYLPDEATVP